jgi:hypothetical protein
MDCDAAMKLIRKNCCEFKMPCSGFLFQLEKYHAHYLSIRLKKEKWNEMQVNQST